MLANHLMVFAASPMTENLIAPLVVSAVAMSVYVFATGGWNLPPDAAACSAVVVAFDPRLATTFPLHLVVYPVVA